MKPKEDITAATKDVINYIYSLDYKERTKPQENIIDKYEAFIVEAKKQDPQVDLDEVPPPFQYPPGANKSDQVLPEKYMYYTETHLNWNVVYTINRTTMEIVGISDLVSTDLIDPSVAQCHDGECNNLGVIQNSSRC